MMSGARRAQVALVYPILLGVTVIAVSAPAFVDIALGDSWAAAAPIMAWVAVSGGLACLTMPVLWVFAARGMGRAITSYNAIATIVALSAMVIGLHWGVSGVAAGVAVAQLIALPLALWILRAEGRLAVGPLAFSAARVLALSMAAGALAAVVLRLSADGVTSPVPQVLLAGAVVSAAFAAAAGVSAYRRDYKDIWSMLLLIRRRAEPTSADQSGRQGPVL
jgi:O-antigen/teichoic acid export membrane protein